MNKKVLVLCILLLFLIGIAFYRESKPKTPSSVMSKSHVTINGHVFNVELATTPQQQEKGLSARNSLKQDQGMLFIFDQSSYLTFWMKDMRFPIDIIFIKNDKIVSIVGNAPPPLSANATLPLYKSAEPSNKVLEINAGLSKKYNIKKGDTVIITIQP